MLVVIRGAGDIATGIALRLWRAGIQTVMTDLPAPTAIRRTVCFSQAIVHGETAVEGIPARLAQSPADALELLVSQCGIYGFSREMLEECGESYAMENACDGIKAIAKHRAPSNEENGVMQILQKIFSRPEVNLRFLLNKKMMILQ